MTFPKVTYQPVGSPVHGVFSLPAYQGGNQEVTTLTILGASLYSWYEPEASYITDNSGAEYWTAKSDPDNTGLRLDKIATGGQRPTYTASNSEFNNRPTVDCLIANLEQMDASPNFGDCDTDKASISMAVKINSLTTGGLFHWCVQGSNVSGISIQTVGGDRLRFRIADGSVTFVDYTVEAGILDNPIVLTMTYDGIAGHAKMFINGVQKGSTLSCTTLASTLNSFYIAGTPGQTTSGTVSADFGEIAITKTDIEADGTLSALNTHLMEKFAIAS